MVLLFSLWFSGPIAGSLAHAQSLPPILQILEKEPQNLDDIEALIQFHWHEKALRILQTYPQGEERVLFLTALSLMGLKRYAEAYSVWELLLSKWPKGKWVGQARIKKAMALSRLKRYAEALTLYRELMAATKRRGIRERLRWAAFKTALEGKQYEEGLKLLRPIKSIRASWWRGWCHFQLGDWQGALENWQQIPIRRSFGFYPRALFWRAAVEKKMGKESSSRTHLAKLLERQPHSYYGFLAAGELQQAVPLSVSPDAYPYPLDYVAIIKKAARRQKLDPLFILALIKQESHFNPLAVSPAGAMGLMQMIPQTALRLAKATKQRNFQWRQMFDADVNIRLGAFYLKFLLVLFDQQLPMAIAAYNAGEEAVSRWLVLRKEDPALIFVEEIPYEETQNYVQRVLANYWAYQLMYLKIFRH